MESKLEMFSAFQLYSTGISNGINIVVDRLWIEKNKVYFRVLEGIPLNQKYFKKEYESNVYSISREDFVYMLSNILLIDLLS